MRIQFFHSTKRINKAGEAPVYCRVVVDNKRVDFSTSIYLKPEFWDGRILEGCPQYQIFTAKIDHIKTRLHSIHLDLELKGLPASAQVIKNIFLRKHLCQLTFLQLFSEYISFQEQLVNGGTITAQTVKTYLTRFAHVKNYLATIGRTQLLPEEFNHKMAINFEHYLLSKQPPCQRAFVVKCLQIVKTVLNYGISQEYIKANPLQGLRIKRDRPKPVIYLTEAELEKLATYRFASNTLQRVADAYLFMCKTALAYCDYMDFEAGRDIQIQEGRRWIVRARGKTKVTQMVPLDKTAEMIIEKYHGGLPKFSNQKFNVYLKEIAGILGIEKHLTTHKGRKTFGTIYLNKGAHLKAVSTFLGHTNTRYTESTYVGATLPFLNREALRSR